MPAKPLVSPERALEVYLSLPASSRGIPTLRKHLGEMYGSAPTQAALYKWKRERNWEHLAAQQNKQQQELIVQRNAELGAGEAVERARIYQEGADQLLARITESVRTIPIETTGDLVNAVKSLIELQGKADVMAGGVSDRTESATSNLNLTALVERFRGLGQ